MKWSDIPNELVPEYQRYDCATCGKPCRAAGSDEWHHNKKQKTEMPPLAKRVVKNRKTGIWDGRGQGARPLQLADPVWRQKQKGSIKCAPCAQAEVDAAAAEKATENAQADAALLKRARERFPSEEAVLQQAKRDAVHAFAAGRHFPTTLDDIKRIDTADGTKKYHAGPLEKLYDGQWRAWFKKARNALADAFPELLTHDGE